MTPAGRIRIGLLNRFDVQSVRTWSGIPYFMARALEENVGDVVSLGPDKSRVTHLITAVLWRVNRRLEPFLKKRLLGEANRFTSKALAGFFDPQIRSAKVDVIFAPVASTEIAYLKTKVPIVYLSDTTWDEMIHYYSEFSSYSAFGNREGEHIEARAIQRAAAIVYPSDWAARSAEDHYHAPPAKVFRIPMGANLREIPSREEALDHPLGGAIELLWVGVDWQRKGAAIAVQCLDELLGGGVDARLTVCGCAPPPQFSHPHVRVIQFLDKSDPVQRRTLSDLFLQAHFFVFPTQAEAYGIVIAEASAHGLPSLVRETGGVAGALRDGTNGFLMPPEADGKAYAEKIRAILQSPDQYRRLVIDSRDLFEERLSWGAWARSMGRIFQQVLSTELPERLRSAQGVEAAP